MIHFWGKDIQKNLEDFLKSVEEAVFEVKIRDEGEVINGLS